MRSFKPTLTNARLWVLGAKGNALVMIVAGAVFIGLGVHRFGARSEHFAWLDLLGCVVGAFGGFFLLLIADYLLHHARLVLLPWIILLFVLAFFEPHAAIGMGLALGYMVASQFIH